MSKVSRNRRYPQEPPKKSVDFGNDVSSPLRFSDCTDLKARYDHVREKRGKMNSWKNLVAQYERHPYKDRQGNIKSNFGQLRYKVDQALTTFMDFATERQQWAKITTQEGMKDGKSKLWSEHIGTAFQRFCIKPWKKGPWEVMMSAKDMLLYDNGALTWEDAPGAVYPDSKNTITVWPDASAGQFPEDWTLLFVEDSYHATELYAEVEDPEVAEQTGWNRGAVMRVLKASSAHFKDDSHERVMDRFKMGDMAADAQDAEIDVVWAYVREYREDPEGSGYRISKYLFLPEGAVPQPEGRRGNENNYGDEYLLASPYCMEHIGRKIRTLNQTPARKYYESTSFAQLIYTTSKQYDILMNRILEAVEDNMRVFLRVQNKAALDKLQGLRMGTFQGLLPDQQFVQDRIQRPVKDAADVLTRIMVDQNVGTGQYQVGEQAREGGNKTATQSEIDLAESTKISSAHLKVFNMFMGFIMEEIYRRFIDQKEGDQHYEYLRRFRSYLGERGVPEKAWKFDNVEVESVISLGAGSPAAKLQGGRIILQTLASPARTPGERQAQRDVVAAVAGVENTGLYITEEENLTIQEDSLIGLENESLMHPLSAPGNIPVHGDHLHMRHIPSHLQAMETVMGIAEQLFQNRQGLNPDDEGIILQTIGDALIGIDNIGAHAMAHAQLASRTASKEVKAQLKGFERQRQRINQRQDKLEQVIGQVQQKRIEGARAVRGQDPEVEHKQRMYALEEEHAANMSALKFRDANMKGEQLRAQSAENADLKNRIEVEKAVTDANTKAIELNGQRRAESGSA